MTLEVVRGESKDRALAECLAEAISRSTATGTVYLGYPVLSSADDRVEVDALLVSQNHGLIAFQLAGQPPTTEEQWKAAQEAQDRLYNALDSHLGRHESLRIRRKLAVDIWTVTVYPDPISQPDGLEGFYCGIGQLPEVIDARPGIEAGLLRALESALQRVSTIKPAKRRAAVRKTNSRGAKLKAIERGIANLDRWQKLAAIESPDGPQRIRGLAGSGKTVVLAPESGLLAYATSRLEDRGYIPDEGALPAVPRPHN